MQYICLILCIAGLLMYLLCANSKAQRIGEILFFTMLIGLAVAFAPASARLFH